MIELNPRLLADGQRAVAAFTERANDATLNQLITQSPWDEQLPRAFALSPFLADTATRDAQGFIALMQSGLLHRSMDEAEWAQELNEKLAHEDADLHRELRLFRRKHMCRIVWRDFLRLADTTETIVDTSLLAETCISIALEHVERSLRPRFGQPIGRESGEVQQLVVIAMGKLGARELNISSDIDLIFTFPEAGNTNGERKQLTNEQYFIKVGQALIAALDQTTADGFVFRVDMRLRPYGDSGALVHNFSAFEEYYQDQGRDWERYAMIKGNPITGTSAAKQELRTLLRPFVYRRYIDFGIIESLRSMKQMITAEVRRRQLQNDVKLGRGGIREIEFIAQSFQLVRGGRDLSLQRRSLRKVLEQCVELGIQGYRDQQSQALPEDEQHRAAMATSMGFANWDDYLDALQAHRAVVIECFDNVIAPLDDEDDGDGINDYNLWGEQIQSAALASLGYQDTKAVIDALTELQATPKVATLQVQGKERLDQFMPLFLRTCAELDKSEQAFFATLPLVEEVLRRSAYLALLNENPRALYELVHLCGASPWIAEQMAKHPVLLDEFLDINNLYGDSNKADLQNSLRQQMLRVPLNDLEAQMDGLRYFKAAGVLRVAASEISGRLPLKKVSDRLTWLAEVILEHVLAIAWTDLTAKYGEPARDSEGTGIAIIGYGKLGGIELGHGSDLDLVMIFDAKSQGVTDGKRQVDNVVFYTRLGQRMIHIMETRMALGNLYEIDMRLRPSGESGMLVSTVDAFDTYQQESAWTWEHQALVRARFVAGDVTVAKKFNAIRERILCQQRNTAELAQNVVNMRKKMRNHLLPKGGDAAKWFDLKQGIGGMVDIEFMVQYAVLNYAHQYPELAYWSDNVRILEVMAKLGLLSDEQSEQLTEAYLRYRTSGHLCALQHKKSRVPDTEFQQERALVTSQWQQFFDGVTAQ